jgi:hypothetical protein
LEGGILWGSGKFFKTNQKAQALRMRNRRTAPHIGGEGGVRGSGGFVKVLSCCGAVVDTLGRRSCPSLAQPLSIPDSC